MHSQYMENASIIKKGTRKQDIKKKILKAASATPLPTSRCIDGINLKILGDFRELSHADDL